MRNIPKDLINKKTYIVTYIVYLDENDQKRYMYIATRKDKVASFQDAVRNGNFDPEDYGIILEEGLGEAPKIIKERMALMYNCNHKNATKLSDYHFD